MTRLHNAFRALLPVLCLALLPAGAVLGATCTSSQSVSAKITQAGFNNTIFQEGGSVGLDVNTGGTKPNTQPPGVFSWSQESGPAVTFSPTTGAHTSFTAPHLTAGHAAQVVVRLTVTRTDCTGAGSATNTVTINLANINNFPPVAVASSSPAAVSPGTLVSLIGTGSYDPDNDPITHAWTQVANGAPTVTLVGATTPTATFTAPSLAATTTFQFRLTVTEAVSSALTGTTTVDVNVVIANQPPVASLSCPAQVNEGATITLNGSGSTDPENLPLTYVFSQTSGFPLATIPPLPHASSVSFPAPSLGLGQPGNVQFGLTVTDAGNSSNSKTCTIFIKDITAPVLSGAADQSLQATSAAGAVATYTVNANDNVDGASLATCVPVSGSTFGFGQSTVNCSKTDSAGNIGTASFKVTVVDSTAPVIAAHANVTEEATSAAGAISNYTVPATSDAVDGAGTATCSPAPGAQFALGTTAVACNATDSHGNAAIATGFNVLVQDSTAPVITPPGNVSAEATGALTPVAHGVATATDAVGPLTYSNNDPGSYPVGVTTIHWYAKDGAGNTSSTTSTVTVSDSTAPLVTDDADQVLEATGATGAVATFVTPTASDLVDGSLPVTCSAASGAVFTIGTSTVTCSATDSHGNTGSSSFDIKVQDTTAPTIGNVADVTQEASGPTGALVSYLSPLASDIVDGTLLVTCVPASGSGFVLGDALVTCSVTDAHGNLASKTFTVHVVDTTPPALTVPAAISTEATGPAGAPASFSASASDIVDGSIGATCVAASGSTFAIGTTTVTCSATDGHGNIGSASFTVTVQDKTPPSLIVPPDMTLEATAPAGAIATFTTAASDIVDGIVATTCAPVSGSTFGIGTTTVNCSATDAHSNIGSASFHVSVVDTTPPVVTVPENYTTEATGPGGTAVDFTSSASDIVDGSITTTCSAASGSTFAIGTTTVSCSATDANNNTGTASFTVTVSDTTPPIVTVPANLIQEATGASGATASFLASASDIVDGSVATTCAPVSGSTFAIGTTTVNCSATDTNHNTGTASFTITVRDTTAPTVAVHSPVTVEATGPSGAVVTFSNPIASDIVDGSVAVTCAPTSGSLFAIGDSTVTCSATDAHNNTGSSSFPVHVVDTTAPVVANHADVTVEATGAAGASVTYATPAASDIVDGSVAVNCVPASGSVFALGNSSVTCSATDAHANTGSNTFTVRVVDTAAPVVANHANLTIEATSAAGAAVTYAKPTATDLVDGSVAVTCTPASGSQFGLGSTTVNCSATDAHGNTGSNRFIVTVVDTTGPAIAAHADVNALATSASGAVVSYTLPTATDLVDGGVPVSCLPVSGSTFAVASTTVNCSSTDTHGNTSHSSFKVIVSYNFSGFFRPVDNLPIINVVKAGQAIPVKFSLGGNMGLGIFAAGYPASGTIVCTNGPVDAVEETLTAGGSSLSYDAATGQYIYVWKSDKLWAATCRQLVVRFADGSSAKVANFNFTR